MRDKANDEVGDGSPSSSRNWLTRHEAAERSGLSVSGLRGRVRLGMLHEYRTSDGRPIYAAEEVDDLVRRRPPRRATKATANRLDQREITARAIELFQSGADPLTVCTRLRLTIAEAERLALDFVRLGGELSLPRTLILRDPAVRALATMLAVPEDVVLTPQALLDAVRRVLVA